MLVYFTLQTGLQDGAWRCFLMSPGRCGAAMVSFFSVYSPENWSRLVCEGGYCCLWTRGSHPAHPPPPHLSTCTHFFQGEPHHVELPLVSGCYSNPHQVQVWKWDQVPGSQSASCYSLSLISHNGMWPRWRSLGHRLKLCEQMIWESVWAVIRLRLLPQKKVKVVSMREIFVREFMCECLVPLGETPTYIYRGRLCICGVCCLCLCVWLAHSFLSWRCLSGDTMPAVDESAVTVLICWHKGFHHILKCSQNTKTCFWQWS